MNIVLAKFILHTFLYSFVAKMANCAFQSGELYFDTQFDSIRILEVKLGTRS